MIIDAVVSDRDGNVIVGLGKDDFTVTDDGKPVELADVKFYSSRARVDAAGRALEPAQAQRLFVLFFHDQRQMNVDVPGVLARSLDAARRAKDWVRTLGPNDYLAVASYEHSLVVNQDFTRDRKAMQRGIDEAVKGGGAARKRQSWLSGRRTALLRQMPRETRCATEPHLRGVQVLSRAAERRAARIWCWCERSRGELVQPVIPTALRQKTARRSTKQKAPSTRSTCSTPAPTPLSSARRALDRDRRPLLPAVVTSDDVQPGRGGRRRATT